jgi:H+-translocating NAD(P) transhydrogenase subunit beta
MPVINVDNAKTVFVLKRSMASGFAGIENPLFYKENTRMLFGDAKESLGALIREFS